MKEKLPPLKNEALRELALTHRSYANEDPQIVGNNERLEFLGDAVLGFTVAQMLYRLYPGINEAQLTHMRSRLVDEKQLGQLGAEFGLGELMHLGKGAAKDGGRENPSLLNDTFEAILGAYYLEAGIVAAQAYILNIFEPLAKKLVADADLGQSRLDSQPQSSFIDSKNRFQQWALAQFKTIPVYLIISVSGPDHAKQFTAQVKIGDRVYGIGKGNRKQVAEKQAAAAALSEFVDIAE